MHLQISILPMLVLLLAAVGPNEKAVQQEIKKLQGTWRIQRFEVGGKDKTGMGPKQIVIKGDRLQGLAPNVKFRIDPSKKPKALDLIDKNNPKKVFPLIYDLKGDNLKIVIPLVQAGKGEKPKRPNTFQTKNRPLALIIARRDKP